MFRKPTVTDLTKRALQSWGVDPRKNLEHKSFWDDYLESARKFAAKDGSSSCDSDATTVMPRADVIEFLKAVLEQEIEQLNDEGLTVTQDHVKDRHPEIVDYLPPYEWDHLQHIYQIKSMFIALSLTESDLDPFLRFYHERKGLKHVLTEQWLVEGSSFPPILLRGVLAYHACRNETCFHCRKPSLEWNISKEMKDIYWRRIICTNCSSVYDVKTSLSEEEKVQSRLMKGYFDGCSFFDAYHTVRRSLPSTAKQFLAIFFE
jgi:hypothetical protein